MRILGIDPGKTGALALYENGAIDIYDMPVRSVKRGRGDKAEVDAHGVKRLLEEIRPDVAYLEKVGGMPGQGAGNAFNFGRGVGTLEGVMVALGIPIERVAPLVWQKAVKAIGGKNGSRARASDMYPKMAHMFARVMDDDRADAALIATYGAMDKRVGDGGIFG